MNTHRSSASRTHIPVGAQFAAYAHSEADITLSSPASVSRASLQRPYELEGTGDGTFTFTNAAGTEWRLEHRQPGTRTESGARSAAPAAGAGWWT